MSVFNRPGVRLVNQSMLSNLGGVQHPRISIRGGAFTLVDAAGQHHPAPVMLVNNRPVMLGIIIAANSNKSRMYFPNGWDPENTEPPTCFSDNGVAPSVNAQSPQAATCGECKWARWDSAVSKLTGKGIPACSSKKKLAVLVIGDQAGHAYELQIPPASLGELGIYGNKVASYTIPDGSRQADVSDFVTAFAFVPQQTGLLEFDAHAWIDSVGYDPQTGHSWLTQDAAGQPVTADDGGDAMGAKIDSIWQSGVIDTLLGLKDLPAGLPAPAQAPAVTYEPQPHGGALQRGQAPQGGTGTLTPAAQPPGPALVRPAAPAAQPPAPPAARARGPRGGARPGAGRPPSNPAPGPYSPPPGAPAAQPQQLVARTAAAAQSDTAAQPDTGRAQQDIPAFLRRANQAPAASAPPAAAPQPAQNGMAEAGAPPAALKAALATAFNLPTGAT